MPFTTRFSSKKPEEFVYDPNMYDYQVVNGQVVGSMKRRPLEQRLKSYRQGYGGGGYSSGGIPLYSGPAPMPTPEKPAPRLIPSERRAIAQSVVLRGFSPLSRQAAPRIASKIETDTERQMLEQQEDRIRDSIISEMLSRYLNPSRRYDQQAEENFARQLDMLARMYGGGVA